MKVPASPTRRRPVLRGRRPHTNHAACRAPPYFRHRCTATSETPIEYLKGVGPQRAELLRAELGIATFGDLLQHFPFRYVDRSRFRTVREVNEELPSVQLRGVVSDIKTLGEKAGATAHGEAYGPHR